MCSFIANFNRRRFQNIDNIDFHAINYLVWLQLYSFRCRVVLSSNSPWQKKFCLVFVLSLHRGNFRRLSKCSHSFTHWIKKRCQLNTQTKCIITCISQWDWGVTINRQRRTAQHSSISHTEWYVSMTHTRRYTMHALTAVKFDWCSKVQYLLVLFICLCSNQRFESSFYHSENR